MLTASLQWPLLELHHTSMFASEIIVVETVKTLCWIYRIFTTIGHTYKSKTFLKVSHAPNNPGRLMYWLST